MTIPSNIEKQDVINAINEINENGIPPERQSDEYFLVYENTIYPPKYVISISNKYANKSELSPDQFSGGKESNSFLNSLGFNVFRKPSSNPGKKWLSVSSEENWEKCKKIGVIGQDESRLKKIKEIKMGDVILVYITGMRIAGICEVSKEYYTDKSKIWTDKLYPHRMGIKLLKVPKSPINIKSLYDIYFGYKGAAGGYFGQGLRELPEHEFSIFHTELARYMNELKRWNNEESCSTDNNNNKYLLLLQQPNSKWKDKEGREYNFGNNVVHHNIVIPGAKVVFYSKKNNKMSFFGHSTISSIDEIGIDGKTPKGRSILKKVAKLQDRSHLNLLKHYIIMLLIIQSLKCFLKIGKEFFIKYHHIHQEKSKA